MINIITLNDKQIASFNGYSIGSYNDNEVTQAITNDNKEPLFDTTGIENINGLTYPFKINAICNDERLSLTTNSILYSKILLDDKNNDPLINITNWLDDGNLRPVSNTTAPFSQWNSNFERPNYVNYILNMNDLPAYTYNSDGVTSKLYINYIPEKVLQYHRGANYSDIKESVEIDWLTWKDHYMTDLFNITTSKWTYNGTDGLPVIQNYSNTYQPDNLESRKLNDGIYSGNFITFDFSDYIGKTIRIYFIVHHNEQAKAEGKYTFFKIDLIDHIPTAQEILNDFNATDVTFRSMAPNEGYGAEFKVEALIKESNHILTLYANPANQTDLNGYTANRFDIHYISFTTF